MYKYKLEMQSKSNNNTTSDTSNSITTLIKLINTTRNIIYSVYRADDNKLIMRGSK